MFIWLVKHDKWEMFKGTTCFRIDSTYWIRNIGCKQRNVERWQMASPFLNWLTGSRWLFTLKYINQGSQNIMIRFSVVGICHSTVCSWKSQKPHHIIIKKPLVMHKTISFWAIWTKQQLLSHIWKDAHRRGGQDPLQCICAFMNNVW